MRSWSIDAWIEATIPFKEPFHVGNCIVENESLHMKLDAEDHLDLTGIEKLAKEEARKVCSALTLATRRLFRFDSIASILETTPARKERQVMQTLKVKGLTIVSDLKSEQKKETLNMFDLLKNADEYTVKSLDYLEKGLVLVDWPEDAFLNYYKTVELMSMKYFGELNDQEVSKIFQKTKKGVTSKDIIRYACCKLSIPKEMIEQVDMLVGKRNSQDIGHAKLSRGNVSKQDKDHCMQLALLLIVNHLRTLANIS
jgi:hypothetical protein